MSRKAQGKAKTRKRSVARDLPARKTTTGGIVYNGHAGLGANAVRAGAGALGTDGIVTNNKDPDKL